jgi:hypothetical protein
MKDEGWPSDEADPDIAEQESRDVVFRNNQFYEIRDRASSDRGAITRPITAGMLFERNWFARSDFLADSTPPSYKGNPVYRNNLRVVTQLQRPGLDANGNPGSNAVQVPYFEPPNTRAIAMRGFDTYERKRWTGSEFVDGAIPAEPAATHGPPDHAGVQRP